MNFNDHMGNSGLKEKDLENDFLAIKTGC